MDFDDAKTTQGEFELPGSYIDDEGGIFSVVKLKEMTGKEEDILAARTIPFVRRVNTVLRNCIESLSNGTKEITDKKELLIAVQKMTIGDRLFLIIALRRVSLGDMFSMEIICPDCKKQGHYSVDLKDLDVKKMEKKDLREYEVKMPCGKVAKMKIMLGEDESRISKIRNENDFLTLSLLARVIEIDGKQPSLTTIKDLSIRDRNYLRAKMDEVEGGIETIVDVTCSSCGTDFKTDLDVGDRNFFFPSEISEI